MLLFSAALPDAGVPPPVVVAQSSSQIQVFWATPQTPNGVITLYNVFQISQNGNRLVKVANSSHPGSTMISGLQSFTEYFFSLEVCTAQGCNESQPGSGFTLESGKYTTHAHTKKDRTVLY